jgi:hypothetical protein
MTLDTLKESTLMISSCWGDGKHGFIPQMIANPGTPMHDEIIAVLCAYIPEHEMNDSELGAPIFGTPLYAQR